MNDLLFYQPPFSLILLHLFRRGMLPQRMGFGCKMIWWMLFENLSIPFNVLLEDFGHLGVLIDCLPWARWFARRAIDTLVRMDVKLVCPFLVRHSKLVDAIDRANFNTLGVFTVDAQLCDDPGHKTFSSFLSVYVFVEMGQ